MKLPSWSALPDIGLYMDQVGTLMERTFAPFLPGAEITKSMVNNYVKAGLIRRPVGKRYDRDQLAQLIMIAVLKQALSMEEIARVLAILCEEGVESGYARFGAEMSAQPAAQSDSAVSSAIQAAVLVIRAKRLIAELGPSSAEYSRHPGA